MVASIEQRNRPLAVAALVAVGFGLLSVFSAGMVLFGPAQVQESAGATAAFVVWFNFLGGFAYVVAGYALWNQRRWGAWLAFLIVAAIAVISVGFGMHVLSGAAYEMRTVLALALRFVVWLAISSMAYITMVRRP